MSDIKELARKLGLPGHEYEFVIRFVEPTGWRHVEIRDGRRVVVKRKKRKEKAD